MADKIDTSALRTFYDAFAPAIAAIPGILDLNAQMSDIQRGIVQAQSDLKDAQDKTDAAQAAHELVLEAHSQELADMEAKKAAVAAATSELQTNHDALIQSLLDEKETAITAHAASMQGMQEELAAAQAQFATDLAAATAEHADKKAALEKELATLMQQRDDTEAALKALRVKLGG